MHVHWGELETVDFIWIGIILAILAKSQVKCCSKSNTQFASTAQIQLFAKYKCLLSKWPVFNIYAISMN